MRNKIRVLQVMGGLDRGGAESMIMNIYKNIDRTLMQFDFVVNQRDRPYAYEDEIESLGGRIYTIPKFNGINFSSHRRAWDELFKSHPEWSILHAHYTSSAFLFLDIARSHGLKTISHSHIAGMEKTINSYIKVITRYPLRHQSDYLIACSLGAAKWMFGKKHKNTKILHNAIETKKYTFNQETRNMVRNKLNLNNQTVVGHIGRFAEQKNHTFLVDVFYEYYKLNSNSILLLIGDGYLRDQIENKVISLGLSENVLFLGAVNNVNELLQGMDLFLFPSLYEGLPVTLVEAQASGLPILASENVTKEIEITDLITFKSLEDNQKDWAQVLASIVTDKRENMQKQIIQAGYDVIETSYELQNYYLSIIDESL